MTPRRILYIGNFSVSHSTETHVAKSLESLGHVVTRCQENALSAEQITELLPGHSLLLWTRTGEWLKGDSARMLRRAKELGIPSASFHLDLYSPLPRSADIDVSPWWKCEYVFTADGGSDDFWKRHSVNHYWLPPAVFDQEAYIVPDVPLTTDVLFCGSTNYHPEWPYRKQLVSWLRETYGDRFRHVGPGGEPSRRGHDLNVLYAGTKVIVGDSLCPHFIHPNYWSDRVPETLGRGGFLIHPWVQGLEAWFRGGMDLAYYQYRDFAGLKEQIDFYLEFDELREKIRRHGHETVKAHSTYVHRMQALLETIFGEEG